MRLTGRPRTPLGCLACSDALALPTAPPAFNARSDCTHTVTLPNHTNAFTGRRVLQPAGYPNTVHHYYTNH